MKSSLQEIHKSDSTNNKYIFFIMNSIKHLERNIGSDYK